MRAGVSEARSKTPWLRVSTTNPGAFWRGTSIVNSLQMYRATRRQLLSCTTYVTFEGMKSLENMTESPGPIKRDRLVAFFEAFELSATMVLPRTQHAPANLVVIGPGGRAEHVIYCARSDALPALPHDALAAATIAFGGVSNPLVNAM